MIIRTTWQGREYSADLGQPLHISIPLESDIEKQPNAFGAPPYSAEPFRSGDFVGSLEAGASVNFFDLRINPHGNGTHTESVGHIERGSYPIHEVLRKTHFVACLISLLPTRQDNGDLVITRSTLEALMPETAEALIVRTLPNSLEKRSRKYFGTNPPYFEADAMKYVHESGFTHLLTDLPSVDREVDGGALSSHKMFWQLQKK